MLIINNRFKDHVSKDSTAYSQYGPCYPPALFEYLASLAKTRQIAWDCATGSGQAAHQLAGYCDRVMLPMPAAARSHENIGYRVATPEHSGVDNTSVDLVTVGQALYWFDLEGFFDEARRMVKAENDAPWPGYRVSGLATTPDTQLPLTRGDS